MTAGGRSIRTKLILAVLVAALAPLAIVGFVSYETQETVALENAFERLEGIAAAQVGQLDALVNADREIAEILVTQTAVRDGLTMTDPAEIDLALASAVGQIERLESAAVVDTDGNLIASSDPGAVGRVDAIRDRLTSQGRFEGVVIEGGLGTPVIMSSTPVVVDGAEVGCVIIETSIDTVTALATNYEGLGVTGETSVAQRVAGGGAEFIAPLRFREGAVLDTGFPAPATRTPITHALDGEARRFDGVSDYRQIDVLAVTRTVEGPGWGVVVKIDRAEALAGVVAFQTTVLWATVVGALLVLLLAVLFVRWITRPIQQLTAAAVEVADGDLRARADVRSRDEIGALASAVGAMTDSLLDSAAKEARRIGELEAVNRQLAESEARVRSIVDNAAEGIITCDQDGLVLTANQAAGSIFGRDSSTIVGLPFGTLVGLTSGYDGVDRSRWINLLDWVWGRDEEVVGLFVRSEAGERTPIRMAVSRVREAGRVSFTALIRDVSESVDFERRLWESAHYDGLTGLPNRELFLSELEQALATDREDGSLSVLFVDLDRFKVVNDAWGHAAGDQVLQMVASRLRWALRDGDLLARFGGDEFVIMAEGYEDPDEMVELGERIIRELESPFRVGDHVTYVGASVGVAHADAGPLSADDLVSQADVAMYGAKAAGRGRVSVFDAAMRLRVQSRHDIHAELHAGIERGELEVHYQPIVRLDTGEFVGAEALARWNHPTRGLLMPGEFIPVAEETGLVTEIGRAVLHDVARQIATWNAHDGGSPRVAVNLSAREVMDPSIVEVVLDALAAAGASPSSLTIEVTESVLVTDTQTTIDNLKRLRTAGIQIALDDFGTGYSSLTYLRDMPVDIVKIDRRFITELGDENAESSIAAMVLSLGATMGLTVVAEGVETPAQHERLIGIGGTHAQGYLYARPSSAEGIEDLFWPADRTLDLSSLDR